MWDRIKIFTALNEQNYTAPNMHKHQSLILGYSIYKLENSRSLGPKTKLQRSDHKEVMDLQS